MLADSILGHFGNARERAGNDGSITIHLKNGDNRTFKVYTPLEKWLSAGTDNDGEDFWVKRGTVGLPIFKEKVANISHFEPRPPKKNIKRSYR